jgi:hypothetical protein
MYGLDMFRSVFRPDLLTVASELNLEPVQAFSEEISQLFGRAQQQFVCTSRSPELLNYLLRFPGGNVRGWVCKSAGRLVGFALTSVGERDGIRMGKILDCWLAESDAAVWKSAIQALTQKLREAGCDVAHTMGSAPWFLRALRASGYFRRGRGTFFLRDLRNSVPLNLPFHLTLIEADQGY